MASLRVTGRRSLLVVCLGLVVVLSIAVAAEATPTRAAKTDPFRSAIARVDRLGKSLLKLGAAVRESVDFQIEECYRIEELEAVDPEDARKQWQILLDDARTNARNIDRLRRQHVPPYKKAASGLRAFGGRFEGQPQKRAALETAVRSLLTAARTFDAGLAAGVSAAEDVGLKTCGFAQNAFDTGMKRLQEAKRTHTRGMQLLNQLAGRGVAE